jgi:hypothetical protein
MLRESPSIAANNHSTKEHKSNQLQILNRRRQGMKQWTTTDVFEKKNG